jgi:PIN domain nuclease of toxin-antitoxin system
VNLLLDTHLLIWGSRGAERLPRVAADLILDEANSLYFSAASLWEVAIKFARGKPDFVIDPDVLRRALTDNGYAELPITSRHAAATARLPPIHRDPFDRMLVVQAAAEGITLLTVDETLARYPGPIRLVS